MLISDLLAQNARLYPNEIALIEIQPSKNIRKTISWREFDKRVNQTTNALIDRGIRKNDKVIHLMMNSIDWLVAYFGIIRTGAWAVPLNFRFTGKEIKYCADIAEARIMILSEEFADRIASISNHLPTIEKYIYTGTRTPDGMETFEEIISRSSANQSEVNITTDDVCGLYFTSGTTGDPKPIVLTHKNMEHAAIVEQKHHYQTRKDNFMLLSPLYHTGSKMHWFGSLLSGSRATLVTEISPKNIIEAMHKERCTIAFLLVPAQ